MSRILVTYATKSGSVEGIADRIAEELRAEGNAVDVVRADDGPDPGCYDAVVVGSGVRAGSWHEPAKKWVTANAERLKTMPVAFFTVGLTITDPAKAEEVAGYTDALKAETGVQPVDTALLAGWFVPERFGFAERMIMKAMKAPAGDHRDMDAVGEWTKGVAPKLHGRD